MITHIDIDILDEQEAARILSVLTHPASGTEKPALSEAERAEVYERIMRGAPTLNVDQMLKWLDESKKDHKLPFREDKE